MRAHPVSFSEGGSEIMGSNPSVQGHHLNLSGGLFQQNPEGSLPLSLPPIAAVHLPGSDLYIVCIGAWI